MARHERTLEAIFRNPVPADIQWRAMVSLLRHLGASIDEGAGSRVGFTLNGRRAVFHRPHPGKELKRGAVRDLREFLRSAGVER